jgi:hypothetical protein
MPLVEHLVYGVLIFAISFELRHWTKLIFEITMHWRRK